MGPAAVRAGWAERGGDAWDGDAAHLLATRGQRSVNRRVEDVPRRSGSSESDHAITSTRHRGRRRRRGRPRRPGRRRQRAPAVCRRPTSRRAARRGGDRLGRCRTAEAHRPASVHGPARVHVLDPDRAARPSRQGARHARPSGRHRRQRRAPKGTLLFLTGGPASRACRSDRIATNASPSSPRTTGSSCWTSGARGSSARSTVRNSRPRSAAPTSPRRRPRRSRSAPASSATASGLYSTEQTVADYESLRRALGVDQMVVDGVSYGSFTAARYAAVHPPTLARSSSTPCCRMSTRRPTMASYFRRHARTRPASCATPARRARLRVRTPPTTWPGWYGTGAAADGVRSSTPSCRTSSWTRRTATRTRSACPPATATSSARCGPPGTATPPGSNALPDIAARR